MARTSAVAKEASKKKYAVRYHSRCKRCGRPRGFLRKFNLSLAGEIPGVIKSSW
jgi:small subunit ribosomal protein S14